MGLRRTPSVLVMLVAAAVFAAGCGSDSKSSDSASTAKSKPAAASGGSSAGAKAVVAAAEKTAGVKFPQPSESFKPGKGRVAIISCGNAGINCLQGAKDAQKAARAMGWQPSPVFDGEFTPAKQAGYVQQAVQGGYDGIVLVSIDANSIKAAIDAAAAKKIPISCVECVNPAFAGKVYDVTSGGIAEGRALGFWVASNAKSGDTILAYDDKSFPIVAERRKNATAAIKQYCPGCKVKNADFPTTDLSKPNMPTFTAALASNPTGSLQFVMSPYDPAAIPMAKVAVQKGRTDFQMTGYDASPDFVQLIEKGTGGAAATTAAPFPYASWGAVDQVARIKAGKEPWVSTKLPAALVTKTNATEFAKGFFEPADFDFRAMFKKLWGQV